MSNSKERMALNVARIMNIQRMPNTLHAERAQAFAAASPAVLELAHGVDFDPKDVQIKLVLQQLLSAQDVAIIATETGNRQLAKVASEMVSKVVETAPDAARQVLISNPDLDESLVGSVELALRDLENPSPSQRSH